MEGVALKGPFCHTLYFPLNPFPWEELYAVRAIERVPAGSCHFLCFADPSQSVVSSFASRNENIFKAMCCQ